MAEPMGVGVVGCGKISGIYFENMIHRFDNLKVISCCANHFEHAEKAAQKYGIEAVTFDEMLSDERIGLIVNLTPVPSHYEIIKKALLAGKNVFTEKAICLTLDEAKEVQSLAKEKGLYLCSAPETFMGEALQTARRLIDEGKIGEVTGFSVNANRRLDFLTSYFGFLNMPGGDIDLDYGVYYMTALISLLGPVDTVSAFSQNRSPERVNCNPESPHYGEKYASPNIGQIAAMLRTESGVTGTFLIDGESIMSDLAHFYIYGTKGVLDLCDANGFGGTVKITSENPDFSPNVQPVDLGLPYTDNCRGIGPSEEADAIASGRRSRTDCAMAVHVLDIFRTMEKSSEEGMALKVETTCARPEAL